MKVVLSAVLSLVLSAVACEEAWARRGGGFGGGSRVGGYSRGALPHHPRSYGYRSTYVGVGLGGAFLFGSPYWGPSYYPAYPVYPPEPLVYIEQPKPAIAYWHFCEQGGGYYPDVKECPGGWLQVVPQPPAPVAKSE